MLIFHAYKIFKLIQIQQKKNYKLIFFCGHKPNWDVMNPNWDMINPNQDKQILSEW